MLRVGKMKFRFKDGGMDFRWGDGEPRRIGFGRKKQAGDESLYPEDYVEGSDTADLGYDGRFSGADEYAEDDYVEEGEYQDDGYDEYDDGYDEAYDDEQYDDYAEEDEYYDDQYDDGEYDDSYEDGQYDDEYGEYDDGYEGEYDDRYYDEDADYGDEYPEGSFGALMQYVDENDWVTYLLLVLLPPLGIYLLWRRQRFEKPLRYGLSAASAIWFVVMIVLLMMLIFGGRDDHTNPGDLTLPSPSATVASAIQASPSPSATATVKPEATPIGGSPAANTATGNIVFASATGNFYHNTESCPVISALGETVTQVTLENAKSRNKFACPNCYGGQFYFATSSGKYYHSDYDCSQMANAMPYSQEMAEAEGKSACPVCVTKSKSSLYSTDNVVFINANTRDKSGIEVWCTEGGTYYHLTSNCSGMVGASKGPLKEALLYGKKACPTCCAPSGQLVWCTKGGKSYHAVSNCSGMENASQVTLAEALVIGKSRCYVCQPDNTANQPAQQTGTYYVYATQKGKYYHINENCSGMTGAVQVPLATMVQMGRPACPDCCAGADMTVYAAQGGSYYHSYATCSGMTNAVQGTLANALALGYQRCTKCWGDSAAVDNSAANSSSALTADNVMVYATQSGQHYHTVSNCSGMTGAYYISLRTAVSAGKTPCSNCAGAAQMLVYSTDGGAYFHNNPSCSGMQNAKRRTLADALMLGQQICPVCAASVTDQVEAPSVDQTAPSVDPSGSANHYDEFTVGRSGVKVYAHINEEYYHTVSNCSGTSGLTQVALEVALNYGKSACPTCASAAESIVYATANGKYYHVSQSCAGAGSMAGTLAYALGYGFTPCPYCVTSTQPAVPSVPATGSGSYTLGTSGVKVYARVDAPYYHASQSCAGSGAVQVTLETALNYGKSACPSCSAVAERTVYAVPNTTYYHANHSCAGSNAVAGTFAQALAYGLTACPNCIGSISVGGNGGVAVVPSAGAEYSAPASSLVYVDLYSDQFYYHKASTCSGIGMSGGVQQTLEFAKDLGFMRCPYCNPPSSIG